MNAPAVTATTVFFVGSRQAPMALSPLARLRRRRQYPTHLLTRVTTGMDTRAGIVAMAVVTRKRKHREEQAISSESSH